MDKRSIECRQSIFFAQSVTQEQVNQSRITWILFISLFVPMMLSAVVQGMIGPLLSVLLYQRGFAVSSNGFNATGVYLGIFVAMLVVNRLIQRLQLKWILISSYTTVLVCTVLFFFLKTLYIWLALRIILGFGDGTLQYVAQLWIATRAPKFTRGKHLALYGMLYSLGFSLGPIGINLIHISDSLPFLVLTLLNTIGISLMFLLPKSTLILPRRKTGTVRQTYTLALKFAWYAVLAAFLYGYLESSVNNTFPLYALAIHISKTWLSVMLAGFSIGTILLQFQLGWLSDRFGRKQILYIIYFLGIWIFVAIPMARNHEVVLLFLFVIMGGSLGSLYTLGLAYTADLLPPSIFSAGNVLVTVLYSLGSISGPFINGLSMQYITPSSMFYIISLLLALSLLAGIRFRERKLEL